MMYKRYLITLLLFNLCLSYSQAQTGQHHTNVVGPSPNAASLGKFVDVPVSLYIGMPQINVPIFTLQSGELSLPISLSYHASGLKVSEISSWAGAGWTLNAGGAISRTIRGIADENSWGFFSDRAGELYGGDGLDANMPNANTIDNYINWNSRTGIIGTLEAQSHCNYLDDVMKGCIDIEPDLYTYSFPGGSGKFIFDRGKEAHFIPHSTIQLQHPFDNIPANSSTNYNLSDSTWTITGTDGTKYVFGASENTTTISTCNAGLSECYNIDDVTTWYLEKITSASGKDSITLYYGDEMTRYSYYQAAISANASVSWQDGSEVYNTDLGVQPCPQAITVRGKLLSSIRSSSGYRVEFIADDVERQDLMGGHRLKAIHIKYNNQLLNKYSFTHSYYDNVKANAGNSPEDYVLRLDNIRRFNSYDEELPFYSFEYEGNQRPSRDSNDQDHWGFYNGAGNSPAVGGSLPHLDNYFVDRVNNEFPIKGKGNRESSGNAIKAGILKKIIYPTGGYAEFDYELHDYSGLIRDEYKRIPKSRVYTQTATEANLSSNGVSEFFFTVDDYMPAGYPIQEEIKFTSQTPCSMLAHPYCYAKLYKKSGFQWVFHSDVSVNGVQTIVTPPGDYKLRFRMKDFVGIVNGIGGVIDEIYEGPAPSGFDPNNIPAHTVGLDDEIRILLDWVEAGDIIVNKKGGGLRIKSIVSHDDIDVSKNIVKNYYYKALDEHNHMTNTSSGRMKSKLAYYYEFTALGGYTNEFNSCVGGIGAPIAHTLFSGNQMPLYLLQGSAVGYHTVTVMQEPTIQELQLLGEEPQPDYSQYGKTVYKYTNPGYSENRYDTDFPFVPEPSNHHQYGLLTEQSVYKFKDSFIGDDLNTYEDNYFLISKTLHTYLKQEKAKIYGIKLGNSLVTTCDACSFGLGQTYAYNIQEEVSDWHYLKESISELYDDLGQKTSSTTTYAYNNYNQQISRASQRTSDDKNITTYFEYPSDYMYPNSPNTSPHPIIQSMIDRNMWSIPIEQKVTTSKVTNGDLTNPHPREATTYSGTLAHTLYTYKEENGMILPKKVYTFETDKPSSVIAPNLRIEGFDNISDSYFKPVLTYDAHDDKGNLLLMHAENVPPSAYIWDKEQEKVIAEVANATHTEIAYTSFEQVDFYGNWAATGTGFTISTDKQTGLQSGTNGTLSKTGLDNSKIYTITYWAKGTNTVQVNSTDGTVSQGEASTQNIDANTWQYFEYQLKTGTALSIVVPNGTHIDEVRLHPQKALMSTYNYDSSRGELMVSSTDAQNNSIYYDYDNFYRLKMVKDQEGNTVKAFDYHYKNE